VAVTTREYGREFARGTAHLHAGDGVCANWAVGDCAGVGVRGGGSEAGEVPAGVSEHTRVSRELGIRGVADVCEEADVSAGTDAGDVGCDAGAEGSEERGAGGGGDGAGAGDVRVIQTYGDEAGVELRGNAEGCGSGVGREKGSADGRGAAREGGAV